MPLTVTVNMIAQCLRTDCNILGDKCKKNYFIVPGRGESGNYLCTRHEGTQGK